MAKTRIRLDAEIDTLNKAELDSSLDKNLAKHGAWEREAAFGLKHMDIPRMSGTPSGGVLNLGADQADQPTIGPMSGAVWGIKRLSVDGLASGDAVKIYKGARFICWVSYQPGFVTFGKGQCVLKGGDYLRVVGTGLTTTTAVTVYGETDNVPGVMSWKILA
jgi:hypothetical protein